MVRFAFDIGTNSIGWAVMEPNEDDTNVFMLDMGVRIFSDGREPSKAGQPGEPLNQTRRQKRMMRRQLERRKRRKLAMYKFLKSGGYVPSDSESHALWVNLDPYALRAEALTRPLNALEIGRVMMQLAARRGFKSNRKIDSSKEASEYKQKISAFEHELENRTLGQYLWEKKQAIEAKFKTKTGSGPAIVTDTIRFRLGTQFYPNRAMYEREFTAIRNAQSAVHPQFDWDRAWRIIFFQRPLKRPERGFCTFYENEYRAYLAQPSSQMFKALQDINNLEYLADRSTKLTAEQKEILFEQLQKKGSLSFERIRSLLGLPADAFFNLEKDSKDKLEGMATDQAFIKHIPNWAELDLAERDALVETFIIEDDEDRIVAAFQKCGIEPDKTKKALASIDLKVGVGSLSAKFMRECSAIMRSEWIRYDEAVEKMGLKHYAPRTSDVFEKLPYYGQVLKYATVPASSSGRHANAAELSDEMRYGRIANPTVHIALNQMRKLCNILIDRYGKPDEIVVEVATELKLGREKIRKIIQEQRKNKQENEDIRNEISSLLNILANSVTGTDILKYHLWQELGQNSAGRHCIYCGKSISAQQLFNGDAEIEHILPFSRTLRNNRNNLTITHRSCNAFKGNRTPYEAFGTNPNGFVWEDIESRAKDVFRYNFAKKNAFLKKDLEEELLENSAFLESQLSDTAYIARATREYLSCLYLSQNGLPSSAVRVVPGRLTSMLRQKWGLNSILSANYDEKNRADHRHHAIDALVIGLTTRAILQRFATANARGNAEKIMPPPFPADRARIERRLQNILISFKPDHGLGGALFDETAYGFIYDPAASEAKPHEFFVRKQLSNLTWNVIKKKDILSSTTQAVIEEFLAQKGLTPDNSDDKKLSLALQELSSKTGMKAVKIRAKNAEGYTLLMPGKNGRRGHKAYSQGDMLFVDIWRISEKKGGYTFKGVYVSRAQAHAQGAHAQGDSIKTERPNPAAKRIMRLYKNDILALQFADRIVYCKVAGFSGTDDRIDLRPIYASGDIKTWIEQTNYKYRDSFWKPKISDHNYFSINSLVNKNKGLLLKHVNISIDGRLLCRK